VTVPVFLRGERVTLHPVSDDDADFLGRIVNDPDVRGGLSLTAPRRRADELEFRVEGADDREHFLVRAAGERVGVLDLVGVDETLGNAEVGYLFAPDAWGNGYATDAVRTAVAYAFAERRLHKVYARVFAFNEGSRRVLEKVGFVNEGRFREHAFLDGEYVDVERYGLLADEFEG
jgi:ribosomal-protein-alanine N-acetyltransferase